MNFTSIFKNGTVLWKTDLKFLKRLNVELPYDPEITLLSTYTREQKTYVHAKTCT